MIVSGCGKPAADEEIASADVPTICRRDRCRRAAGSRRAARRARLRRGDAEPGREDRRAGRGAHRQPSGGGGRLGEGRPGHRRDRSAAVRRPEAAGGCGGLEREGGAGERAAQPRADRASLPARDRRRQGSRGRPRAARRRRGRPRAGRRQPSTRPSASCRAPTSRRRLRGRSSSASPASASRSTARRRQPIGAGDQPRPRRDGGGRPRRASRPDQDRPAGRRVTSDTYADQTFTGEIIAIAPAVDAATNTDAGAHPHGQPGTAPQGRHVRAGAGRPQRRTRARSPFRRRPSARARTGAVVYVVSGETATRTKVDARDGNDGRRRDRSAASRKARRS